MRKKTSLTIVEQAVHAVPGFKKAVSKLEQQVTLRGRSKSTLNNYIRRIALFVTHFRDLPENISEDEINEYLAALAQDPKSPSRVVSATSAYGTTACFINCCSARYGQPYEVSGIHTMVSKVVQ